MESRETLPLPQSPGQTIETLGTKPHCQMCALYALTRAKLKRVPCRTCATKAFVDSPLLLLYLFREFVSMSNQLHRLVNRDKDMSRTVLEEFSAQLDGLRLNLNAHLENQEAHPLAYDRDRTRELEARIDALSALLSKHRDNFERHFLQDERSLAQDFRDRVHKLEHDFTEHKEQAPLHLTDDDDQFSADVIDRLETLEQDLPRHTEDPAAHANIRSVPDPHDLPERVSKIERDLHEHFDYPRTHYLDSDRSRLDAAIKRIDHLESHDRDHTRPILEDFDRRLTDLYAQVHKQCADPTTHFLEPDRQALSDTIDRVEAIQKELDRLRNS